MAEHAIVSPSKLESFALCPGKFRAETEAREKGVEETTSPAAEEGTRRHALMEGRLRSPELGFVPAEEMTAEDVIVADTVWQTLTDLRHPAVVPPSGNDRWIEQRVEVGKAIALVTNTPDWPHQDAIWGTLDLGMAYANTFEILDWKFGRYPVEPGLQLMAYAVGLGRELDWYGRHQLIARGGKVRLTIVQPWRDPMVRSADYPIDSLGAWGAELKGIVDRAMDPNAPRVPGESQCRFCLAAGTCPERLKVTGQALFEAVGELPPEEPTVEDIAEVAELKLSGDPKELSPAQMGRIMDEAPRLEGFFKSVREEAWRRLKAGDKDFEKLSGWKLVKGKRKKEWTVPEEDRERKLRDSGLALKEIYPRKMATVTQLDAAAKAKTKRVQQKFAELWAWEDGKPVLAPEGDERPSILEEMFEDLEKQEEDGDREEPPEWML